MNMKRLIKKWLFPVNVDSVLKNFNKNIQSLREVVDDSNLQIEESKAIVAAEELKIDAANKEADRATSVISKLEALIGD